MNSPYQYWLDARPQLRKIGINSTLEMIEDYQKKKKEKGKHYQLDDYYKEVVKVG